jgi:hypothetical protein
VGPTLFVVHGGTLRRRLTVSDDCHVECMFSSESLLGPKPFASDEDVMGIIFLLEGIVSVSLFRDTSRWKPGTSRWFGR